jgi:hypothetical protein
MLCIREPGRREQSARDRQGRDVSHDSHDNSPNMSLPRLACQSRSRALVTKHHKEHMIEGGRAREQTGLFRDDFGGACQIHTSPLRQKKWPQLKKKCSNWVYKKSFFLCIGLNEIDQNFTKITKFL